MLQIVGLATSLLTAIIGAAAISNALKVFKELHTDAESPKGKSKEASPAQRPAGPRPAHTT
jgi:hypothetical protein